MPKKPTNSVVKKAPVTRRSAVLEGVRNELHNTHCLLDQASARITELQGETSDAARRIVELETRIRRDSDTISTQRESIATLKKLVSELEQTVATQEGAMGVLYGQIDGMQPKVMVRPAVMLSPEQARKAEMPMMMTGGNHDYMSDAYRTGTPQPKHWTSL